MMCSLSFTLMLECIVAFLSKASWVQTWAGLIIRTSKSKSMAITGHSKTCGIHKTRTISEERIWFTEPDSWNTLERNYHHMHFKNCTHSTPVLSFITSASFLLWAAQILSVYTVPADLKLKCAFLVKVIVFPIETVRSFLLVNKSSSVLVVASSETKQSHCTWVTLKQGEIGDVTVL